jgi:hypothetical protein
MTAIDESRKAAVPGAPGVSAVEFREAMGHFATGVAVVTSIGEDGEPVGTTANAVTSLSLDPPLLLVCFDLSSATLRAIRGHGAFAVNVLGHRQRHLSANFARRGLAAAWDGCGTDFRITEEKFVIATIFFRDHAEPGRREPTVGGFLLLSGSGVRGIGGVAHRCESIGGVGHTANDGWRTKRLMLGGRGG